MSRRVPSGLVIGGDQPFVRRLIGVATSSLVGSIYNMGVWDKVAAAWINVATRRTLDREEAARLRYKETRRSLENGGCTGDPHIEEDSCGGPGGGLRPQGASQPREGSPGGPRRPGSLGSKPG